MRHNFNRFVWAPRYVSKLWLCTGRAADPRVCPSSFVEALAQFGLDGSYIVSNVNCFMGVPVAADGAAVNVYGHSAERDLLAVLSNCPQMHNSCNAYNLTPIRAVVWRPSRSGSP
jgi:hypothetical protein